jgi:hypothetical protein
MPGNFPSRERQSDPSVPAAPQIPEKDTSPRSRRGVLCLNPGRNAAEYIRQELAMRVCSKNGRSEKIAQGAEPWAFF